MSARSLLVGARSERLITTLRRVHGGVWQYEAGSYGRWHQVNTGRRVERFACLDGDDDNFRRELRWLDTGELVSLVGL